MEFLVTNYKELIIISGLIITFYSKIADSRFRDKELEFKKYQFKEDKKHQITKEKYQELFAQKIKFYITLHKELDEFNARLIHISKEEYQLVDNNGNYQKIETREEDIPWKLWKSIHQIFKDNLLFISDELDKPYQKILSGYTKALVSLEEAEYGIIIDKESHDKVLSKMMLSFFEEYKEDINSLISIIEEDIKKIKSDLGFNV